MIFLAKSLILISTKACQLSTETNDLHCYRIYVHDHLILAESCGEVLGRQSENLAMEWIIHAHV